jgi:hypothetical protein
LSKNNGEKTEDPQTELKMINVVKIQASERGGLWEGEESSHPLAKSIPYEVLELVT